MYETNDKEWIFVFTGPDGAGRKTIAEMAGTTINMKQVLSYTTRKPRPNETDGIDYRFVSLDEFARSQKNDEFIEAVQIDGNWYGVKSADVRQELQRYGCVYLVLNRQGSDILKRIYGDKVIRFFIYADIDTVVGRLKQRGESEEAIRRYMSRYEQEMAYKNECEHAYENIDSSHTMFDLTKTMESYLQRGLLDLD